MIQCRSVLEKLVQALSGHKPGVERLLAGRHHRLRVFQRDYRHEIDGQQHQQRMRPHDAPQNRRSPAQKRRRIPPVPAPRPFLRRIHRLLRLRRGTPRLRVLGTRSLPRSLTHSAKLAPRSARLGVESFGTSCAPFSETQTHKSRAAAPRRYTYFSHNFCQCRALPNTEKT